MEIPEIIEFNGVKYKLMGQGKYYLSQSNTNEGRKHAKGLHVAIWEFYNKKEVPKGYEIHHKDGNHFNNNIDNLECISIREHHKKHFTKDEKFDKFLQAGQEARKEWHKSEEGKKWHSEHAKEQWENKEEIEKQCKECGKIFKTKQTWAEYCCDLCGEKWRRKHKRITYKRNCIVCGKEFEATKQKPSSKERLTCCRTCANKLNHENRKKKSI